MILTNKQFYEYYTDYDALIDSMRTKLLEAMKRNPGGDFSQANYAIAKVQRLQTLFHSMYHTQQVIDNDSGKVMQERSRLIGKIAKLEKENEELKLNITSPSL